MADRGILHISRAVLRLLYNFPTQIVPLSLDLGGDRTIDFFLITHHWLSGATLRERLQKEKRLAPPRALSILRGVCAAVEAAHRRQLLHRDLKPENIFLVQGDSQEMAKVLDFGIAKFLPSASQQATVDTGAGMLVGTLRYMSPEQLRGEEATPAWDLWALAWWPMRR